MFPTGWFNKINTNPRSWYMMLQAVFYSAMSMTNGLSWYTPCGKNRRMKWQYRYVNDASGSCSFLTEYLQPTPFFWWLKITMLEHICSDKAVCVCLCMTSIHTCLLVTFCYTLCSSAATTNNRKSYSQSFSTLSETFQGQIHIGKLILKCLGYQILLLLHRTMLCIYVPYEE